MVWTEILTEDIADVHVGDRHVLVPLSEDISEGHVRQVMDSIVMEECMTEQMRRMENLREQLEQQRRMDEVLEATGYEFPSFPNGRELSVTEAR